MMIRSAHPTDAQSINELIYSSGPAAFEYVFSPNYSGQAKDFLCSAFQKKYGSFSYKMHKVIELGDEPTANEVVASFMSKTSASAFKELYGNVIAIFSYFGFISAIKVIWRGLKIETMLKHPVKNRLYIGHLGVSEALRGKGLGKKLIIHATEIAKAQSLSALALDVSVKNPAAQRLYQRLGFTVIELNKFKYNIDNLEQVPDHHYMEMSLYS